MTRLEHFLKELENHPEWPSMKDGKRAWYLASILFSKHYQKTTVRHRLADALKFADTQWDGQSILDDNHRNFILVGVITAVVGDRMLESDFTRTLADLFYVYHAYWRRYHRTLRGGPMADYEWRQMLKRFESLSVLERVILFEEFVAVMLEKSEGDDWILADLAPFLPLDEANQQMLRRLSEARGLSDPIGRKTWEAVCRAALDSVVDALAKWHAVPKTI